MNRIITVQSYGDLIAETYSDERLDALGGRYIALCLSELGITFEHYLAAPHRYDMDEMAARARRTNHRLVLDAEATVAHLPCRDGAVMEPMRHHRNPKRSIAAYFNRRAR